MFWLRNKKIFFSYTLLSGLHTFFVCCSFKNTIRGSNFAPDVGLNCLQRLLADNIWAKFAVGKERVNMTQVCFIKSMKKILCLHIIMIYGPRLDKTCLRGFRQSKTQNSLLSYRD